MIRNGGRRNPYYRKQPELIGQSSIGWPRTATNTTGGATGDDVYQIVQTVTLPAGTMGLYSKIVIIPDWDYLNSAATKYLAVDFGATNIGAVPVTTTVMGKILHEVQNLASLSVQKTMNGSSYGVTANARIPSAIDTASDVLITFKTKWGAANAALETNTLLSYSIWHFPGDRV